MDGTVNPWLDWIVASVRSHILRSYSNGGQGSSPWERAQI
jgi:hypothetical protein